MRSTSVGQSTPSDKSFSDVSSSAFMAWLSAFAFPARLNEPLQFAGFNKHAPSDADRL
jgi:hypothetical protein